MQSSNSVATERPIAASSVIGSAAKPVQSILFIVHEDDGLDVRLQSALSMARSCSAHLHLLHVVPAEAYTVVDTLGTAFASGEIVDVLTKEAQKLRSRLERHLSQEDVSWSYDLTISTTIPALLREAALADLIVMGRKPAFHEMTRTGPGLVGELLCSARVPILVPGDRTSSFDPFGRAVIAWNGSSEAASAVRSTVGLLKLASDVRVISFEENNPWIEEDALLRYLAHHDLKPELERRTSSDIAADLVDFARLTGAEYLVMGGYSHSRAGEFLFGGVTRSLLHGCPISLIMAH